MREADGPGFFADHPHQGVGHFREAQRCPVAHAQFHWKVLALAHGQDAPHATHAAHGDVQGPVVHAALFVKDGFNEWRVDVCHKFGVALDVVGQVGFTLHNDEGPFFSGRQTVQRANHLFHGKRLATFLVALRQQLEEPLRRRLQRGPVSNGEQELTQFLLKDNDDGQNSDGDELAQDFAHEAHAHEGDQFPNEVDGQQPHENGDG